MDLKKISDANLLVETRATASKEREVTTLLLKYLSEIDRRKLYVERGFPSLFAYCKKELRMSEGQAFRRIKAARLLREIPELSEKIAEGKLTLSGLTQMAGYFQEQKTPTDEKKEILNIVEGKSTREIQQVAMNLWGEEEIKAPDKIKVVSQTQTQMVVTVDDETLQLLNEFRGQWVRLGVKNIGDVIKILCQEKKKERIRREEKAVAQVEKESLIKDTIPPLKVVGEAILKKSHSRYIPLSVKRQVFVRAGNACEFVPTFAAKGMLPKKCESKMGLEVDHIRPFAHGGGHDLANLQLLCHAHHARRSFQMFGWPKSQNSKIQSSNF